MNALITCCNRFRAPLVFVGFGHGADSRLSAYMRSPLEDPPVAAHWENFQIHHSASAFACVAAAAVGVLANLGFRLETLVLQMHH